MIENTMWVMRTIVVYGFLIWLIPFLVSFCLIRQDGTKIVNEITFKTIMIIVSSATGSYLLPKLHRRYNTLRSTESSQIKRGLLSTSDLVDGYTVGIIWMIINWILDFLVLLPLTGMSLRTYFLEIGLRYFNMLFQAVCVHNVAVNMKTIGGEMYATNTDKPKKKIT